MQLPNARPHCSNNPTHISWYWIIMENESWWVIPRRLELIRVKTNGKRALMLYHGPLFQGTKVIVITFYFDSTYSVQDMYTWPSEQSLNWSWTTSTLGHGRPSRKATISHSNNRVKQKCAEMTIVPSKTTDRRKEYLPAAGAPLNSVP